MRLFGHPVHVMLVHFPVALWPAHFGLHLASDWLPAGVAVSAGFWLLLAGTVLGWLAAMCGALDWAALDARADAVRRRLAGWHGLVNGTVLAGFTALLVRELAVADAEEPEVWLLAAEGGLLALMLVGNFLGGAVIWRER